LFGFTGIDKTSMYQGWIHQCSGDIPILFSFTCKSLQ
jgi:hypothetical protein